MAGTIKMFCIRMNILSHRNNIELFLSCNMAAKPLLTFIEVVDKFRNLCLFRYLITGRLSET